ncbi:phage protein [Staphylococcus aureus]|nr:phage protein [Staphylococcus aureus]
MFAKEAAINVTANEFVNKYEDEIEVAREKFANTYLNKSED